MSGGNPTGNIPVILANADVAISQGNIVGEPTDTSQTNPFRMSTIGRGQIIGDVYLGEGPPSFASVDMAPSHFSFEKLVDLASAATSFTVWTVPTDMSFIPTMAQGRIDIDVTATTGDFWSLGIDGSNRRVDYGVCTTAAGSSKHSKNAKFRFLGSPEKANQIADSAEILKLMSVDAITDAAALANNIGGSSQLITLRIAGNLVGNIPNAA